MSIQTINQKLNSLIPYAPAIVRIGISLVVIWFGVQQMQNPISWLPVLPEWTQSLPISQVALIYLNAWFEIVFGLLLLVGFYTRPVALLVALHLLDITFTVGYGAIGVRDFGLAMSAMAIFVNGYDKLCVDKISTRDML